MQRCADHDLPETDITDVVLLGRTLRKIAREEQRTKGLALSSEEELDRALHEKENCAPLDSSYQLVKGMCVAKPFLKYPVILDIIKKSGLCPYSNYTSQEYCVWLSMFQCNNFAITDERMVTIGAGVYPIGSLINHSCQPNCISVFEPKTHVQVMPAGSKTGATSVVVSDS